MRILTSNGFVEAWNKGKIAWFSDEAIHLPVATTCPHCKQGIVLTQFKEDKKNTICFIMDKLSLFLPTDMKPEQLEKAWNDILRPTFFQWLAELKMKQTETKEAEKATRSQPKVGGAIPPLATPTKKAEA